MDPLGTQNHFGVGLRGLEVTVLRIVNRSMSKEAALNLAAWLVAVADDKREFDDLLKKVREA